MAAKVKIKLTGDDAKALLNEHDNDKVSGGKKQMKPNPESRQAEDTNASERSDITKPLTPTTEVPTPEARVVAGFDTVKVVDRERGADCPEAARQRNNRARDARTNLGRGKSTTVVLD